MTDTFKDPKDVPTIDMRDMIGDPEDKPGAQYPSVPDSPGTPGRTAGTGGINKPQEDLAV